MPIAFPFKDVQRKLDLLFRRGWVRKLPQNLKSLGVQNHMFNMRLLYLWSTMQYKPKQLLIGVWSRGPLMNWRLKLILIHTLLGFTNLRSQLTHHIPRVEPDFWISNKRQLIPPCNYTLLHCHIAAATYFLWWIWLLELGILAYCLPRAYYPCSCLLTKTMLLP